MALENEKVPNKESMLEGLLGSKPLRDDINVT
jgi:hypothetical protein